jgi:hypothetical protein
MNFTTSKPWKWQSATLFTAALVGAAASTFASASGCDNQGVVIHNCPDAGAPDSGDDGGNGGVGGNDPYCH